MKRRLKKLLRNVIVKSALVFYKNKDKRKSIDIDDKSKILNSVVKIYNIKNRYSREPINRSSGYYHIRDNKEFDIYYFDCSSFVSSVFYDAFKIDLVNKNDRPYTTNTFLKDAIERKHFVIVKRIKKENAIININDIEIGDIILGFDNEDINKEKNYHIGHNHIMIYLGDNKIVHSTESYYKGNPFELKRDGIVYETIDDDYYLKIGNTQNERFNKEIYILRYKK